MPIEAPGPFFEDRECINYSLRGGKMSKPILKTTFIPDNKYHSLLLRSIKGRMCIRKVKSRDCFALFKPSCPLLPVYLLAWVMMREKDWV